MLKKFKNLGKRTKVIIMLLAATILIVSATGVTLYTRERQQRAQQTQVAYDKLTVPGDAEYSAQEKEQLQKLLSKREELRTKHDFKALDALQQEFDDLDTQVKHRIDDDKKYHEKKTVIDAVTIVAGANDAEQGIFNTRKAEVLALIERRVAIEEIEHALKVLNDTNTDIQQRLDAEATVQAQHKAQAPSYEPSRSGGGAGSGNRGASNPGSQSRGNQGNGSASGNTPERCIKDRNGSTLCAGGDW